MKAEREKSGAKPVSRQMRLNGKRLELPAVENGCYLVLVCGGSCTLTSGEETENLSPGTVLLLGAGCGCTMQQAGRAAPELHGCEFSLGILQDLYNDLQWDFAPLFAPGQRTVLHGPVEWASRLRRILELMRGAESDPEYPGGLYLALLLHEAERQYLAGRRAAARLHNETVEKVCAYLAENYQQKFSLGEVAAQFYLSPYYLSRLFRRVTGQSIVDYVNGCRIEAAQRLLENTELSISAVAEQTGFSTAAHFRRVFHDLMGVGPLQYRKSHRPL